MLAEQEPETLISFLELTPSFILPLIGVIIGALLSWWPIRWQLKHDSEEREKERKMSIRRDVYLFAAEKFGSQLSHLANFYAAPEPYPKGYEEAIEKINLIGNSETVNSVNKFHNHLTKAYYELIPEKIEIDFLIGEHNSINELMQQVSARVDTSLQDMKEHNMSGVVDSLKWSCIKGEFKLHQEETERLSISLKQNTDKQLERTLAFAIKCRQKAQLAEELQIPVIISMRKELDTPFDEEAYRAMMKTSSKEWKKNLDQYIKSMKDKFKQFSGDEIGSSPNSKNQKESQ